LLTEQTYKQTDKRSVKHNLLSGGKENKKAVCKIRGQFFSNLLHANVYYLWT